jgi:hypothetical protein
MQGQKPTFFVEKGKTKEKQGVSPRPVFFSRLPLANISLCLWHNIACPQGQISLRRRRNLAPFVILSAVEGSLFVVLSAVEGSLSLSS